MADGTTWEDIHAERIARFSKMTPEEWARYNAKAMLDLEIIWMLASRKLDDMAGDDRTGELAQLSAEAGEVFHAVKGLHRRMDGLAARAMSLPVARDGSR